MLIDKFRGLILSDFDWEKILMYSLPIVSFIIGLLVPSPLFDRLRKEVVADDEQQLVEVTGLIMSDGSRYDGSIIIRDLNKALIKTIDSKHPTSILAV